MEHWDSFFKSEIRSAGRRFHKEEDIRVSQLSDTELQSFVKTFKIKLKSPNVESSLINASCSCPAGLKANLCKHVYAAILTGTAKFPDFFEGKKEIETVTSVVKNEKQTQLKERQAQIRKEQYQKQKQRLKKIKLEKKGLTVASEYPEKIQQALSYFEQNGFPMQHPLQADDVKLAKKKLSRVFHPDFGGSHDEITELNHRCELLLDYISGENNG